MNGKDIFLGLKYIGEDLVEEAEYGRFSQKEAEPPKVRRLRRPLLIAAIVALMLFLMGCAVYVLTTQNMELGQREISYDAFDPDTLEYLGKETYTEEVFTVAGLKGSPEYQAALEWFEFKESYDQDRAIQSSVWGNYPEFPEEYSSYGLYSQEMKDKLDKILDKYSLKPQGAVLEFRNTRNLCAALGIERLQTTENDVSIRVESGGCYENGNFYLNLDFDLPEAAENEIDATWGILRWNRKDCFSTDVIAMENADEWKQWDYETASGSKVLILRNDADWRGYLLCDRGEGILSIQLETRQDLWYNVDGKTWAEEQFLTDKQMELIADAIDFGIQPRVATREDVANQPSISDAVTQDGYTLTLKTVETDGWVARIVLSITAPEGTVISHNPHLEEERYYISPSNFDNFECQTGNEVASSGGWNPIDDGDGLDHTQDIEIVKDARMDDGSAPFGPGMVWNIYFADLIGSYYDSAYQRQVEILAEGDWLFPITFGEENADYTELELIREPVTVDVCTGWYPDGTDAVDQVTVSSCKLRKFSATIEHDGEESDDLTIINGERLCVVMKDGTQIQLSGQGYHYDADTPIDLSQVDHILFPDGTKLTAPET